MSEEYLLHNLLDRPIAFQRAFVPLGGVCTALMLSQALYWSKRTNNADGWFYKTQADWEAETGMTRYEQEGARKKLSGILLTKRHGTPAKLYYRVDFHALAAALKDAGFPHTEFGKTSKQDAGNSPNIHYAESTTETTASPTASSSQPDLLGQPTQPLNGAKYSEDFLEFWKVYPRSEGKKPAYAAWKKLPPEDRKRALEDCRRRYADTEKQYVPHASTYLNQERWEDDLPPKPKSDDPEDTMVIY